MEQFRRFEAPAMEFMSGPTVPTDSEWKSSGEAIVMVNSKVFPTAPSRYDAAYYRTHDPLGYIAPSVASQAYSNALPMLTPGAPFLPPHLGGGKRGTYSSMYAPSYASQQAPSQSGDTASIAGGMAPSSIGPNQWDRLKRRTSAGSVTAASDAFDYKTMQDDASTTYAPTGYAQSQAGYTDY